MWFIIDAICSSCVVYGVCRNKQYRRVLLPYLKKVESLEVAGLQDRSAICWPAHPVSMASSMYSNRALLSVELEEDRLKGR